MKKVIELISWKLTPTSHETHWGGCTRTGSQGKVGMSQEMTEAEPKGNSAAQCEVSSSATALACTL